MLPTKAKGGSHQPNILRRLIVFFVLLMSLVTITYYMQLSGVINVDLTLRINNEGPADAPDATEIVMVAVPEGSTGSETGVTTVSDSSDQGQISTLESLEEDSKRAATKNKVPQKSTQYSSNSRSKVVTAPKGLNNRRASKAGWTDEKPADPVLNASFVLATREEMEAGQMEFAKNIPAQYFWFKNKTELQEKWYTTAKARRSTTTETVKIACLFAGFVRDYENMFRGCRDSKDSTYCSKPKLRKFYGNQREYLLDSTDCDVFISTWDIRGGGRFNTVSYDMSQRVDGERVRYYYRHRIAGLHVQSYKDYQHVWRYMHKFRRMFPQMRPTYAKTDGKAGEEYWRGDHESNEFIRLNDYSQSYKHWAVVQLAMKSGFKHDLYYRMRCDLRMTSKLSNFHFHPDDRSRIDFDILQVEKESKRKGGAAAPGVVAMVAADDDDDVKKVLAGNNDDEEKISEVNVTRKHYITPSRIHTSNFDIADFGFMGTPSMIQKLTNVWWYCTVKSDSFVPLLSGNPISEYNLMVWRIIFDAKWEVDSGGRYLWVSRRHGQNPKSQGGTVVIKKIIIKKKPRRR